MSKGYERFQLGAMNIGVRIFGGGMILAGVVFLASAAIGLSDRIFSAVVGIIAIVIGVACFMAKPVTSSDLENIRTGGRDPNVRFRYEKGPPNRPNKSLERTRER